MNKEIDIPQGHEAVIEGNKVIIREKCSDNEKIINQIISLIKEVQEDEDWHIGKWSDDAIAWLEKQKEQQPAEWSEEDKQTIRDAINRIKQLDHYWNRATDENLIKRLKSLHSPWKPSKKQMETLKNCAYGAYQNGDGPTLRELYNDLEKLCYE